ncbi:MAG: bifunctional 5,10-methylenetetrahydrofolate dehydrogenase/5,10-methenyltetrahydrofolate cyclohydrolase [Candidatus Omnitrophota bacterium]
MQSVLLEGRPLADKIKKELTVEIARIKQDKDFLPNLAAIQVGDNQGASVYINAQKKFAENIGIQYLHYKLADSVKEAEVVSTIYDLNKDKKITGIIIIAPVPKNINYQELIYKINPEKDVEGMHPENLGFLTLGKPRFSPCAPQAIIEILKNYNIGLYGKEVVIVGSSEIVGKPLVLLLLKEFATVTVCHIATYEAGKLISHTKEADILISAVGKPNLIKSDWIKKAAVVVDVGISRVGDRLVGDIDFSEAIKKASFITPVPGGVGPLTTAILMKNVVSAYRVQEK